MQSNWLSQLIERFFAMLTGTEDQEPESPQTAAPANTRGAQRTTGEPAAPAQDDMAPAMITVDPAATPDRPSIVGPDGVRRDITIINDNYIDHNDPRNSAFNGSATLSYTTIRMAGDDTVYALGGPTLETIPPQGYYYRVNADGSIGDQALGRYSATDIDPGYMTRMMEAPAVRLEGHQMAQLLEGQNFVRADFSPQEAGQGFDRASERINAGAYVAEGGRQL